MDTLTTSLSRGKVAMQFGADQLLLATHATTKNMESIFLADAVRHLRTAAQALGFDLTSISTTTPTAHPQPVGLSNGGSTAPLSGTATLLMSAMESQ